MIVSAWRPHGCLDEKSVSENFRVGFFRLIIIQVLFELDRYSIIH